MSVSQPKPQDNEDLTHSYLKGIIEHQIYVKDDEPEYGQIFVANKQTKGALEPIAQSRGKKILSITGGKKKIYLFQEVDEQEHVVTAIHPESEDFLAHQGEQTVPIDEVILALQGSKIKLIKCGKQHNVILTQDGAVYSFGKNSFGSLGLGGKIFQPSPKRLFKLNSRKIVLVSCGFYHSLALSNIGDLYSWGRGFEGQLGLLKEVETASSPQYISHFYKYDSSQQIKTLRKNPIQFIACGASHSMAIDTKGVLYCWGEARFGQTGNGKKTKQSLPVAIKLQTEDVNFFRIQGSQKVAKSVKGGLGHTLCLTTDGLLFSWGLNIKGQLGINDLPEDTKSPNQDSIEYLKASYYPLHLKKSRTNQLLPKFTDIACGFCTSFAIDQGGSAWGWGGGALGFKDVFF